MAFLGPNNRDHIISNKKLKIIAETEGNGYVKDGMIEGMTKT